MNIYNFSLILVSVLLNAIAQLFLKSGTNALGVLQLGSENLIMSLIKIGLQPYIFSGLLCNVLSVGVWIVTLSKVPVSVAYPMLSIGYVVNCFAAWYLFGEVITAQKIIGVTIIIFGVYLVAKS